MSTQYLERIKPQVFPLSVEQHDIVAALREWYWTGDVTDHQQPDEQCEMCLQDHLRWHFTVENRFTQSRLEIGSHQNPASGRPPWSI